MSIQQPESKVTAGADRWWLVSAGMVIGTAVGSILTGYLAVNAAGRGNPR